MTGHEVLEEFLKAMDAAGTPAFNVAGATQWINAQGFYAEPVTHGDVSKMFQRYAWAATRRAPGSQHRSDAFVPMYVIDCDMRGGPNAVWKITQTDHDLGDSVRRTAKDMADTLSVRTAQRIDPALVNHPTMQAMLQQMHTVTEAQVQMLLTTAHTLP